MHLNYKSSLGYAFTLSLLSLSSWQLMSRAAWADVQLPTEQVPELEQLASHSPSLAPDSVVSADMPFADGEAIAHPFQALTETEFSE
ncbi:MAG: hypothetical protein AAGH78_11660, partial [Cyanobacteria bacterium P01_H01_bin.58]